MTLLRLTLVCVACLLSASPTLAQGTSRQEIHMAVSDVDAARSWYARALGLHGDSDTLSFGEAGLVLSESPAASPSSVIKIGIVVPDIVGAFTRVRSHVPQSVVVELSDLPEVAGFRRSPNAHASRELLPRGR